MKAPHQSPARSFSSSDVAWVDPTGDAERPLYDARRPDLKRRWGKAWYHFRQFVKDKENTKEVFRIIEALPWTGLRAAAETFLTSKTGRAIRAAEPYLPPILDDHAALRRMPAGSLAHAYCDFMEREDLTAQGLVDEFDGFNDGRPGFDDQFSWYLDRMRDTHDLQHVLTGFGRDALGEQCLAAFTYSQQPGPAHLMLSYAGALEIKRRVRSEAPVLRAVREGQRLGKACPTIVEQPFLDLLPLPIATVRARLNLTDPGYYRRAHEVWSAQGIDPFFLLSNEDR